MEKKNEPAERLLQQLVQFCIRHQKEGRQLMALTQQSPGASFWKALDPSHSGVEDITPMVAPATPEAQATRLLAAWSHLSPKAKAEVKPILIEWFRLFKDQPLLEEEATALKDQIYVMF